MKPYVPAGETFHSYYKPDDSEYEWMITYKEIPISGGFYTRYYLYRMSSLSWIRILVQAVSCIQNLTRL